MAVRKGRMNSGMQAARNLILIGVILVLVLGIFVAPMQRLEFEIEIKVGLAVETAKSETSLSDGRRDAG